MIAKEFLIIGSGLSGLVCALRAAAHGSVAILAKRSLLDANTAWAQGGIAAAVGGGRQRPRFTPRTL